MVNQNLETFLLLLKSQKLTLVKYANKNLEMWELCQLIQNVNMVWFQKVNLKKVSLAPQTVKKIPVIDGGEVPSSLSGKRKILKAERSYEHLKKKHISYTAAFKAQFINDHENGTTVVEIKDKYSNFRVDKSKVSRWLSKKEAIKKAALGEHKNLLRVHPGTK